MCGVRAGGTRAGGGGLLLLLVAGHKRKTRIVVSFGCQEDSQDAGVSRLIRAGSTVEWRSVGVRGGGAGEGGAESAGQ